MNRIIQNTNHSNIILYNIDTFNTDIYFPVINEYNHKVYDITFTKTEIYYRFDMQFINNKNKLKDLLEGLLKTGSITYYIFINFNNISNNIQIILRNLLDTYKSNKFIFTTQNLKHTYYLKDRCICIRNIPESNYDRYVDLSKTLQNLTIDEFIKEKEHSDEYIQWKYNTELINKPDFINDILNYILKNKNVKKYNELSYLILCSNIPLEKIFHGLLEKLMGDNKITNDKKYKLVELFSETDHLYTKSYYKMIYLEYLFIGIMNIIK